MYWRAKALELDEWDRIAWLCFYMPRFSRKSYVPDDFHPLRAGDKKMNLGAFTHWVKEMHDYLPATMSNEEIESRWKKAKEKMNA